MPPSPQRVLTGDSERRAAALLLFALANVLLALARVPGFEAAMGQLTGGGRFRLLLALTVQLASFGLGIGLLLVPLARSRGRARWTLGLIAPTAFTALQALLFADEKLFKLFHYHLNRDALRVLSAPGAVQAMGIDGVVLRDALLRLAFAGILELTLYLVAWRLASRVRAHRWDVAAGAMLCAIAIDFGVHAVADAQDRWELLRVEDAAPLYGPHLVTDGLRALGVLDAGAVRLGEPGAVGARPVRYPLRDLQVHPPRSRPDLLWIVIDSWRGDALSEQLTPRIWEFAQHALVFTQHVSGANETRYGNFSMFYGLPGPYLDQFQAERRGPVLVSRLRALGYDVHVVSSQPFGYTAFQKSIFVEVADAIEDRLADDREAASRAAAFLEGPAGHPRAVVLFLNAVHLPYVFPPEFGRHTPFAGPSESFDADPAQVERLHNRYLNAVGWEDEVVGELLRRTGPRLDQAIVVITADHGEEFHEHGAWTHTSSFHAEQVRVPLVLHLPGVPPGVRGELTSHFDLVPTLMSQLGVENPPADYSTGRSLVEPHVRSSALTCDRRGCAITDANGNAAEFSQAGGSRSFAVFDRDRRPVHDLELQAKMSQQIEAARHDLERFH